MYWIDSASSTALSHDNNVRESLYIISHVKLHDIETLKIIFSASLASSHSLGVSEIIFIRLESYFQLAYGCYLTN